MFMRTKSTKQQQGYRKRVLTKCWSYLDDNFHKFKDGVKIKVVLALCTKDLPSKIEGEGFDIKHYTQIFENLDAGRIESFIASGRKSVSGKEAS